MSKAFRCDALDTPQAYISNKNVPHKIGLWEFRAHGHFGMLGQNGPFYGLCGPRSKCVVTMCPTQAGRSGAVGTKSGPSGPSKVPQKGHFGPKRVLLGPLPMRDGQTTREDRATQLPILETLSLAIELVISTVYPLILLQLNFIKRQTPLFKV